MPATRRSADSRDVPAPAFRRFGPAARGIFLAVVTLLASCQTAPPAGHPEDEVGSPKSVLVGELIAIFPGLLWHGLGHRYAGDVKKAEEIELMEAYSLIAGGAGAGMVLGAKDDDDLKFLEISGYTVGGLGALLFVGSWLYDVIYTPAAVNRYNKGLAR